MKPLKPAKARVKSTRMPSASAPREMKRGIGLDVRTITLATVLVLGIFTLAPQAQVLIEQQQQLADIRSQVAASEADVEAMKAERTRWEDPVYIRSQARDRLYYVMPGEVSYLVMDATGIDESDVSGTVGAMIAALDDPEKIAALIAAGRAGRALIPGKHGGKAREYSYLPIVIDDKPGQLGAIFNECAAMDVNVEDLNIEHSPGQLSALITLALSHNDAEKLSSHLSSIGWNVHPIRK